MPPSAPELAALGWAQSSLPDGQRYWYQLAEPATLCWEIPPRPDAAVRVMRECAAQQPPARGASPAAPASASAAARTRNTRTGWACGWGRTEATQDRRIEPNHRGGRRGRRARLTHVPARVRSRPRGEGAGRLGGAARRAARVARRGPPAGGAAPGMPPRGGSPHTLILSKKSQTLSASEESTS